MRIVYDDSMQKDFIKFVDVYMLYIKDIISQFVKYDYGMERVQRHLVLENFDDFLYYNSKFQRGRTVTHANGIGNNCLFPVYYKAENELQHCANINFNIDCFGSLYISVEDYNGKRITKVYQISQHGIKSR